MTDWVVICSLQISDPDLFLKSARLQRLPSSASDLAGQDVASLRETNTDPFTEDCACQRDGLTVIITACLTFATGVTVALIMQIYFGDPQVWAYGCCFLLCDHHCNSSVFYLSNYKITGCSTCLTPPTWVISHLGCSVFMRQVFNQGAVVTDVAQCTSLGFDVLGKQGSSVDAAIAAALCLGIVHPHTSGIGG